MAVHRRAKVGQPGLTQRGTTERAPGPPRRHYLERVELEGLHLRPAAEAAEGGWLVVFFVSVPLVDFQRDEIVIWIVPQAKSDDMNIDIGDFGEVRGLRVGDGLGAAGDREALGGVYLNEHPPDGLG